MRAAGIPGISGIQGCPALATRACAPCGKGRTESREPDESDLRIFFKAKTGAAKGRDRVQFLYDTGGGVGRGLAEAALPTWDWDGLELQTKFRLTVPYLLVGMMIFPVRGPV